MSAACAILAALVPLLATADVAKAQAAEPVPVTFARAGGKATVTLAPVNLPSMTLALRAYGRVWTTADARNQGDRNTFVATFDVPAVRVPVVFSVTHEHLEKPELAQVVAYPDRDVPWNEEKDEQGKPAKKITLYAAGAPEWFNQWSAAVGLPVQDVAPANLPAAKLAPATDDDRSLLILGPDAVGRDLFDIVKVVRKINILVLDGEWFGRVAGPVSVAPAQMLGGLAKIATQRWPQPLEFSSHRSPWPGIANRRMWIGASEGLPWAEQVCPAGPDARDQVERQPPRCLVFSYLPWAEQLGRREAADATLLGLLAAAARARWLSVVGYGRTLVQVWPPELVGKRPGPIPGQKVLPSPDRPVLSAVVLPSAYEILVTDAGPAHTTIVDLRGKTPAGPGMRDFVERSGGFHHRVLILGDDRVLDTWTWLKLDRAKKTVGRQGVVWLSDDELPPSKESRVRLMLKLTEFGVPLGPPDEKKETKQ